MIVREVIKKNGETEVKIVNYKTGETLAHYSDSAAQAATLSETNGVMGTKATLKAAMKLDAELGVSDCIRYVPASETVSRSGQRVGTWKAQFESREARNRWLRAHRRVDYDAGWGDPAPGDFQNSVPHEFEGMEFE